MQAEKLDKSIYDIQEMARERGIILSAAEESAQKSEETAKKSVKKLRGR